MRGMDLKLWLGEQGLSVREFAFELDVPLKTAQDWVYRGVTPSPENQRKLAGIRHGPTHGLRSRGQAAGAADTNADYAWGRRRTLRRLRRFHEADDPTVRVVGVSSERSRHNLEEPDLFNRSVMDFLTLVEADRWVERPV